MTEEKCVLKCLAGPKPRFKYGSLKPLVTQTRNVTKPEGNHPKLPFLAGILFFGLIQSSMERDVM